MNRILLSLTVIAAVAAAVVGGTQAFFSDTETSAGNTLSAGSIDLQIDNTSYLNGLPNSGTSWLQKNLAAGDFFFNFSNLQPQTLGEDTISLHSTDASWACMNVVKTMDDDVTCTDSELEVGADPTCVAPGVGAGELGSELNFAFWADDGDNVLETGETVFKQGSAASIFTNGAVGSWWTLSDPAADVFTGVPGTPVPAATVKYVGKAWCYGSLTAVPENQDNVNTNGPTPTRSGFTCNGSAVTNASQTDQVMADVKFYATQSANNGAFLCSSL